MFYTFIFVLLIFVIVTVQKSRSQILGQFFRQFLHSFQIQVGLTYTNVLKCVIIICTCTLAFSKSDGVLFFVCFASCGFLLASFCAKICLAKSITFSVGCCFVGDDSVLGVLDCCITTKLCAQLAHNKHNANYLELYATISVIQCVMGAGTVLLCSQYARKKEVIFASSATRTPNIK